MSEELPPASPPPPSRGGSKPAGQWEPPALEAMQAILPQYQFANLLGRGGMGAVYKAVQVSLDRPVAIKVLPGDLIDDGDANFVERFKNEARAMAKMNHPGIVNVYEFGEAPGGLLYFVMEFVDGTDVAQMIRSQGKLLPEHALAVTAHVCDALQYAHDHSIIHRDIKPANVLISTDGLVKVADFGLAKIAEAGGGHGLTKTNIMMGTPDYMAPEALIPGVELDRRADLYAVGVMLYHMLTGHVPRGVFEMPSGRSGGEADVRFDAIIKRAMEMDREERYQTAFEIRRDLDVILTTPKLEANKPSSAVIPKPDIAAAHEAQRGAAAQKVPARGPGGGALIRRPPGGAVVRRPQGQVVTFVPQKKSSLLAVAAGVILAAGLFFAYQYFSKRGGAAVAPAPAASSPSPPPSPPQFPASSPPSSEGARTFGGHRYKFFKGPFEKGEDSDLAVSMGGHLATITSAAEQLWIEQTFARDIEAASNDSCRIGGQPTGNQGWNWKNGEPWSYTNWAPGFPSATGNEPILVLRYGEGGLTWRHAYWSFKRAALVEWDDSTKSISEPSPVIAAASPAPEPDTHSFGGHRYTFVRERLKWREANARASAMGGHLATITTQAESDWVAAQFGKHLETTPWGSSIWLGARRDPAEAAWKWATGEPFEFTAWAEGEPNDLSKAETLHVGLVRKKGGPLRWNDLPVSLKGPWGWESSLGFLVEWDGDTPSAPKLAGDPSPAAGATINLLAGVDAGRGAVKGEWAMTGEGLAATSGQSRVFEFSHAAPAEYDFEIEFTISSGLREVVQVLPLPTRSIVWKMGPSTADPTVFGFGPYLDGRNLDGSGGRTEARARMPRLKAGQRYRCSIEVRKGSLRALLDGSEIVGWSGDFARFGGEETWRLNDPRHPGVAAYGTSVVFHKAGLRPVSVSTRLAQIEAQFREAYERDVTRAAAGRALADLDGKYLAALDRALADATKAGRLEDVVALRDEKQRVADMAPLPAADPVNIVSSLKKLRDTYRTASPPLIRQRDADAEPVYARYDAALEAFQAELTQKNQAADALAVKSKRDEVARLRRPQASAPAIAAAGPPPGAAPPKPAESAPKKDNKPKPGPPPVAQLPPEALKEPIPKPFSPLEAVQWALSLGGGAKVKKGSVESEVLSVSSLPKGAFVVTGLRIGEKQPLHVVSLAALSGLAELRELALDGNLITDAGLPFLPKLPKLTQLNLRDCSLTDAGLAHLAKFPSLTHLGLRNNPVTGSGLRELGGLQMLDTIDIGSPALADEHIANLAAFGALTTLDLSSDKPLTCTSLAPLAVIKTLRRVTLGRAATDMVVRSLGALPQVETLDLAYAPIGDFALEYMGGMKGLRDLVLWGCPNLTDVGFGKLQSLKSLQKLNVGRTRMTDAQLQALSTKLSEITDINVTADGVTDAGLSGLVNMRKLSRLSIHVRMCTDLGLGHVRRVANLAVISIDQIHTLSQTRFEALKRALPTVDFGRR